MKRILTMAFALLMVVGLAVGCTPKDAATDDEAPIEGVSDEATDVIEEAVEAPADVEAVAPVEAAPAEPAPMAPIEEEVVEEELVEEAPAAM